MCLWVSTATYTTDYQFGLCEKWIDTRQPAIGSKPTRLQPNATTVYTSVKLTRLSWVLYGCTLHTYSMVTMSISTWDWMTVHDIVHCVVFFNITIVGSCIGGRMHCISRSSRPQTYFCIQHVNCICSHRCDYAQYNCPSTCGWYFVRHSITFAQVFQCTPVQIRTLTTRGTQFVLFFTCATKNSLSKFALHFGEPDKGHHMVEIAETGLTCGPRIHST